MRGAFYVRVSTERQQHAQTIEQQLTQLRAYVDGQQGWTVGEEHIFRDDGYSGAKLDRPGLDALRDQAARAAFDVVLLTAPERLARKFAHQLVVLEELERRGVRVLFIDRPLSDDPHEQLVLQIRGAVAEYERTLIGDRMRRGRLSKLRSGQLLPWTRAPYGYRLHPERPRDPAAVQVDPAAGAVVQELLATYAAGGVTLHSLAVQLTQRQVPTATGKAIWTPCTIRQILTNPAYKGEAASGRLRTTPARGRRSALEPVGHGVSTRVHPPEEWITVPVPALVSSEQFDAAQRRLATNQQCARRSTSHPYLLRGLVSCGVCGLSCSGMIRSPDQTRYSYYRCRGKLTRTGSSRATLCPARLIPAAQLDELVWTDLCAVVQHPESVAQALERAHSGAWIPEELRRRQATLRGVRASLVRQRERLLQAYLAEVVDLETFQRQERTLRQQEEDLRAREREVVAQGERLIEVSGMARSMLAVLGRLRVGLEQATFEQRRQLVELLIDRVVVTNGAVEIRYVIPTTESSTHSRFCHLRIDYFPIEPSDVGAPDDRQVWLAGPTPPQPEAFGNACLAGQVLDLDQHQGASDDGFGAIAARGRVVLRLGVHTRPGAHPHPTILRMRLGVLIGGCPPGPLLGAGELLARLAWSPHLWSRRRWRIGVEAAVAPQPHQHRDPFALEVGQFAGQLHRLIAGSDDAQRDGSIGGQVLHQLRDRRGGDRVGIATSRHALHVHWRGPAIVSEAQLRQPGVRPAGDDRLPGRLTRGREVMPPARTGLRVITWPHAGVQGVDRLAIIQGVASQQFPPRGGVYAASGQGVIQAAPPTAVDRCQAQVR